MGLDVGGDHTRQDDVNIPLSERKKAEKAYLVYLSPV